MLERRTAVVPGGPRDVGRTTVERPARDGARVVAFLTGPDGHRITGRIVRATGGPG
ncbi:hypothetical protein AB0C76_28420 [Kitasatospora sp. NPDC048722]|uniref:hypothetical protein n=1 Tax=Kitasatospora sp. NPDC048722 TaxID=3155639 RepID=UPI0033C88714